MADRAHQVFIDDRYSYTDSLGSGGMARVLLAHDTVLDRDVAIKVLHRHYAEDDPLLCRSEADLAQLFATELVDGIEGTGVRAGLVKTGVGYWSVAPFEQRVLAAAARGRDGVLLHSDNTDYFLTPADPAAFLAELARRGAQVTP